MKTTNANKLADPQNLICQVSRHLTENRKDLLKINFVLTGHIYEKERQILFYEEAACTPKPLSPMTGAS